jgi:glycosyltransferase involved in cell wall biosynthesis
MSEIKKSGGLRLKGDSNRFSSERPVITVVTVVRNNPEALEKTIRNVIDQTYDNLEYIIIDGASNDDRTLNIIRNYEDRIDLWISEPDRGIYNAMNKGIHHARGEWINFMNAGDLFYEEDTIEKVMDSSPRDADFIYGHTFWGSGDFNNEIVKAWDIKILWKTMIFSHQSLFTRTSVLKERNFNIKYKISADYNIIYSSFREGKKFYNSDIVISRYDGGGLSRYNRSLMAFERWRTVRRYKNDWETHRFYLSLILKRFIEDKKISCLRSSGKANNVKTKT